MALVKLIYELESAGLTLVADENPRDEVNPRGTGSGWVPEATLTIDTACDEPDTLIQIESRAGVLTVETLGKVIMVAHRDAEGVWREVVAP